MAGQIGITFYTGVECGAKAAAKDYNVDLNWNGSHNWDINEERPIIDADLATNPQGWVISPTDPDALISTITDIMTQGHPVVTIDAPMSKPAELQNIQSNHYQGGQAAAAAMVKLTGGQGQVPRPPDDPGPAGHRRTGGRLRGRHGQGRREGPAGRLPGHRPGKAADAVTAAINANPDLKGVYARMSPPPTAPRPPSRRPASRARSSSSRSTRRRTRCRPQGGRLRRADRPGPVRHGLQLGQAGRAGDPRRGRSEAVQHDAPTKLFAITKENADSPEAQPWVYPADLNNCPTKPLGG